MENQDSPEAGQTPIIQDDPVVIPPSGNRLDETADPTPPVTSRPEITLEAQLTPAEVSISAVSDNTSNVPDTPSDRREPDIQPPAAPDNPVVNTGTDKSGPSATGMDDYSDIRAQMDESQAVDWLNSQFEELIRMTEQEPLTGHEQKITGSPAENSGVKQRDADAELPSPEMPIPPQPPESPATGQQPERAQTTAFTELELEQGKERILSMEEPVEFVLTAENTFSQASPSGQNATKPTQSVLTAGDTEQTVEAETTPSRATADPETKSSTEEETDGIVYGPRRPEQLQREDLDKIIKALSTEEQRDNTVLYRLDGEDAFRDLGNRLEMCNGASQDKRRVLAALAVASRFYGGVVELTGSTAFKEQAMRLIIENDLDIRMKLPAQRAQLDALRQQMGATNDAITTHIPTPDLNRHTPSPDAVPSGSLTPARSESTAPTAPNAPVSPVASGPEPKVPSTSPPQPAASPASSASPAPAPDSIKVPEMPVEPAPSTLKPGQSVTAVLKNFGEAMYENKEQQGKSFFIELQNRGGSHTYWGQDLRELIGNHKAGDVVTLTLNSRDSWHVPGEERERVKNNWSLSATPTGLAVAHDRPEQGQPLQAFPVDTFGRLTQQIRQAWPEYTADLKLPPRLEERQFWLGEDRHPVKSPQAAASITPPATEAPDRLIPVMASMGTRSNQLDLLLVQSAGDHLQGMVRLDGTLYPALATPTADNSQLVINAITDDGPRFAGYGQAVNFEPDGTTRAAPQLMSFHLKGRNEDTPLPARLYTPEKQADTLFQRLGFEQTWKQWDDARKPEGRQEKALHQEHSHSPGR